MDTGPVRCRGVRDCRESVAGTAGSIVRWTGDYSAGSAVLPLLAQTGAPSFHDEGSNVIETHEHTGDFKEW
jgi:hypothetical protein